MKLKWKLVSLAVCLSFCLVALFNVVYFKNEDIETHQTVMHQTDIDYMSLLDEFDESEVTEDETSVKVEAVQYVDEDFFNIIDNASTSETVTQSEISYDVVFDKETNTFTFVSIATDKYGNETRTETVGAAFINDAGELDALFVDEEGSIYLSELTNEGEVNNCGFFSKLKKAIKKIAPVALVVAAVVTVAIVVAVAAPAAVAAAGAVAGTTSTLALAGGGTIAVSSTATAIVAGASAAATAAAGVIGSAALVGAAVGVGVAALGGAMYGLNESLYNAYTGTQVQSSVNKGVRSLTSSLITTLTTGYELTAERDYKIAYIANGQVIIENSYSLTYAEALSVLVAAGFLNGMTFPSQMTLIAEANFSSVMTELLNKIKPMGLSPRLIGIYTYEEADAAKLAYACGGFFNGLFESENHDITSGSGHYYHFHDIAHKIHVFYGNPS